MEIEFAVNGRTWRVRRVMSVSLFVVFVIALVAGYLSWRRGMLIAELSHQEYSVFYIRQIPMRPPGLNDGYAYRCEVWSQGILMKAATYRWDSFTASSASIALDYQDPRNPRDDAVVFNIGEIRIKCTPYFPWDHSEWTSASD
jgi:hypothetical protein